MKPTSPFLDPYGTTIFEEMSALARAEGAVNLGQGFPDDGWPEAVVAAAAAALTGASNQYPPMHGIPELRQAIAAHAKRFYDLDLDWARETCVTSGATEAITASLLALLGPGDEAVVIEPLYDTYVPAIRLAGATPRVVRLEAPDWALPADALAAAFGPKTKLILINSPTNPIGKVYTADELELIAELCRRWDAYAVCDEVYEHLVYDGRRHVPLMTLPGMRARTVRIASAGKSFCLTGWKVGLVSGPERLIERIGRAHQYLTFTTPPNLQHGVAVGLGLPDAYFDGLAATMARRRDRLAAGLTALGFGVLPAAGSYFVVADVSRLGWGGDDRAFVRRLTTEAKVAAIPLSALYEAQADAPRSLVRFCFCKLDQTLDEGLRRLAAAFPARAAAAE